MLVPLVGLLCRVMLYLASLGVVTRNVVVPALMVYV